MATTASSLRGLHAVGAQPVRDLAEAESVSTGVRVASVYFDKPL
jgi:hypothetical protein